MSGANQFQLSITDRNTEFPFFPSYSWNLLESDKTDAENGRLNLNTFNWIQAFFDPIALNVIPRLAIWSGTFDANGEPILSEVRFAYSGERVPIKGKAIYATGINIRGQDVSSAVIGSDTANNLTQVIAYGGMY